MYNYNQIIEYIDETWDENLNAAHRWARDHFTTFNELVDKRKVKKNKLHRYFQIGPEVIEPEPTVDDLKAVVRLVRNSYLSDSDKYMLEDFPITVEEKEQWKGYRKYLRDYTNQENWWLHNPLTFDEWRAVNE